MSNGQSFSGKREHGPVIIFRNIPYAEPPTGNRRWKEPTIKTSYSGPIDGTKQGYACATVRSTDNPDDNGESEDCLHVNVSVAEWVLQNKGKVPVVAYVHGGGHNGGTNGNPLHYLADQGLVVFNIRWVLKMTFGPWFRAPFGKYKHGNPSKLPSRSLGLSTFGINRIWSIISW